MDVKITEDYVSFETAKLLKEKGFLANDRIYKVYHLEDKSLTNSDGNFNHDTEIAAPTHQMALKWLREKHHILIQVELYSKRNDYCFEVYKNTKRLIIEHLEIYNSYEEATEGAILYCINNEILWK